LDYSSSFDESIPI
jgi:hypothetical protein